jgi:hypothetical protein
VSHPAFSVTLPREAMHTGREAKRQRGFESLFPLCGGHDEWPRLLLTAVPRVLSPIARSGGRASVEALHHRPARLPLHSRRSLARPESTQARQKGNASDRRTACSACRAPPPWRGGTPIPPQTPPIPMLRICIIKPTGFPRPLRERQCCF